MPTIAERHERRLADGRLNIAAVLVAAGPGQTVTLTCRFLDVSGQPAGPDQVQTAPVSPGEPLTVQFSSLTAAATNASIAVSPEAVR